MRSGFALFSLSISAPQSTTTLSSAPAAIAAMQAAGSTGGTVPVSAPVACSEGEIRTTTATIGTVRRIAVPAGNSRDLSITTAAPLRQRGPRDEIFLEPSPDQ